MMLKKWVGIPLVMSILLSGVVAPATTAAKDLAVSPTRTSSTENSTSRESGLAQKNKNAQAVYAAYAVPVKAVAYAPNAGTTLPLEIFNGLEASGANTVTLANGTGVGGAMKTVTVTVANAANVSKFWMQIHSLTYQDKASVQINSGSWVTLNNTTTTVLGPARFYGGIGGSFRTLKLSIPVAAGLVVNGANVIRFRFNKTDGESMGLRILNFNFLDASDAKILPNPPLPLEDPATWAAPFNDADLIAQGEALWHQRDLMVGSPRIEDVAKFKASCADCHAQSGYDLKYFNFSNESIVERSKFHGLSALDGQKIAAFIRTRAVPFVAGARAWNPPFQPGTGLEAKPIHEWAAGAGVDAVLDSDADILNYIPSKGENPDDFINGARFKKLNVRDIPISLELPDWNHWLPRVHPLDSMGQAAFENDPSFLFYDKIRKGLSGQLGMSKDEYIYKMLRRDLDGWAYYFGPSAKSVAFAALGRQDNVNGGNWTKKQIKEQYAAVIWSASKLFELMHEFDLEGKGRELYGLNAESRMWPVNRQVFNFSPHLLDMTKYNAFAVSGDARPELVNLYFANAWYWLQILLNPGARGAVSGWIDTNDWDYTSQIMATLSLESGYQEPMRAALIALKGMDDADNGYGPMGRGRGELDGFAWGWDLRDNTAKLTNAWQDATWNNVSNRKPVLTTIYQMWLEKSGRYGIDEWSVGMVPTHDVAFNYKSPLPTYVLPDFGNSGPDLEDSAKFLDFSIRHVRNVLQLPNAIPNAMADFGLMLWRNNPWGSYKITSGSGPSAVQATADVEKITLSWQPVSGATSYNVRRTNTPTGTLVAIGLFVDGTTYVDKDLAAGKKYYYQVSANVGSAETNGSVVVSAQTKTGLVGYWSFDSLTANAPSVLMDESVTQNPFAFMGTVSSTAGHKGSGILLGAKSFVGTERNLHWLSNDFTFSAWVKTTATGSSEFSQAPMLSGNIGEAYDNDYVLYEESYDRRYRKDSNRFVYLGALDASGKIGVALGKDSAVTVKSTVAINNGQWRCVSFSRNASTGLVKVYVDGQLSAASTLASGELYQRSFSLGRPENGLPNNYWRGGLDEVRIYNKALTDAEVTQVCNDQTPSEKSFVYVPKVIR